MIPSPTTKQQQIVYWIQQLRKSTSNVFVNDYCYNCYLTGDEKNKTIIVFPEEVEQRGIISIDKPLKEIELIDIIGIYKRIKCN